MRLLAIFCALVCPALAREYTELERSQLPRLYHLDDYERCVGLGGLYCTGTFRLYPEKDSMAYKFIKEYASDPRHFDRTLLHRGYCLSARCPTHEANTTLRFERCVEQHALVPGLRAAMVTHSCSTRVEEVDTPQRIFLYVVVLFVALNVLGTMYDLVGGEKKNKFIVAWSVRANWRRLVSTYEDGDPRLSALAPIQGVRVVLLVLVMMTHSAEIQHKLYQYNPNYLEQILNHPVTMLIRNGSALVQGFVVISNFLFAYSLLLIARNRQLGLAQLPMCLLHRFLRLAPVHLLVVGFAATWWRRAGDGPQWHSIVGAESDVCRRKFFSHAFFLHNLVNTDEHCLLQTWFIAVDMQLYIVASVLTLWLMEKKKRAVPLLTALFFGSCLMNMCLAYINDWKSLLYIMLPENVRTTFRGVPSFSRFYVAPWGSLPACFLGLLLAHLHYHMQENGYKLAKSKILYLCSHSAVPLHVACIMAGNYVRAHTGRLATALYAAVERPAFALLSAVYVIALVNHVDNIYRRLLSLRLLQALGRLSLAVLMLHWCVNMMLVASRRTLSEVSVGNIASDLISTIWWTYVLALPLTLLVESPIQKTFSAFISS
ncbi:regulator of hypoxia-inducible factor 1-like [Colias croceus]|uniref:regulator of hypoxia-inducible factor 1-like n=1 Tax=Colias crocea TaxID=72248 RepID=UPI001E27DFE4|nr:regulator of hypoxia-inducible factor 1-like [Colias croceus]